MLNHLDQGLDKGHVMHFKDELQPVMFASIWFVLQLLWDRYVPFQSLNLFWFPSGSNVFIYE